jgi:hypothetical protein
MTVTGHHARLGTRLLATLYRGRHLKRQSSTRLQGATLADPDVAASRLLEPANAVEPYFDNRILIEKNQRAIPV